MHTMVVTMKFLSIVQKIVLLLVIILVAINLLYMKELCSTRQCLVINISTILLLVWVIAFWLVVLKYSKKEKK